MDNKDTTNGCGTTTECCSTTSKQAATFKPAVDLMEDDRSYRILADVPGSRMEDIAVDLENGVLTVSAHVRQRSQSGARLLAAEYGVGDFHRSFRVGDDIDAASVTAEYGDGVLTVNLPKGERTRSRRIPVSTST